MSSVDTEIPITFVVPTPASAPFDHEKADIILRSSDNVYFRVFRLFLSLASHFFETLFDVPQPVDGSGDQETKDGLPVIPLTEDSRTLDFLLRFCYPCTLAEDPKLEVLKDATDVLEAARKYSLDAIEKKARQAISNPKILEAEPLRCFAIAHRGQLREETLLAARATLAQPLIPSWFQEIKLLTATNLLSLLTYHRACGEAVYALRTDLSWIESHYGSVQACSWLYESSQSTRINWSDRDNKRKFMLFRRVPHCSWWEDFMGDTFMMLRDKPSKKTLQACAETTIESVKSSGCEVCSPQVTEGMRDLVELFTRKIDEVVSKVSLNHWCYQKEMTDRIQMVFSTDPAGVRVLARW